MTEEATFEVQHSMGLDESVPKNFELKADEEHVVVKETPKPKPKRKTKKKEPEPEPETESESEDYLLDHSDDSLGDESVFDISDEDEEEPVKKKSKKVSFAKPKPKAKPKAEPTKKEWDQFLQFMDEKQPTAGMKRVAQQNERYCTKSLEHLNENLEIIRRMGNVKWKLEKDLTLDDYLAWYVVESGKVQLPPGALDLVGDPETLEPPKREVITSLQKEEEKKKEEAKPVPGIFSLTRWF